MLAIVTNIFAFAVYNTAVEPPFVGIRKALKIPNEVKCCLLQVHQMYLANEFGIQLQ